MGLFRQRIVDIIELANLTFSEIFHNNSPLSLNYVVFKSFLTSEMRELGADNYQF